MDGRSHTIIFPTWVSIINGFQMRVPVDDTHTLNFFYHVYVPPDGVELEPQEEIPGYDVPYAGEDGRYLQNFIVAQDSSAWVTQGPIADRTREKLGQSDVGVIMYRKLLEEQMRLVEDGADPMNTFRDPAENEIVYTFDEYRAPGARPERGLLQLGGSFMSVPMSGERDLETGRHVRSLTGRYSPIAYTAEDVFAQAKRQAAPSE